MPTKALSLNTGDKTKSKYSPQKILSSIKREWVYWIGIKTVQVTFHEAWSGLIDGASVKPFVIGENPQEENFSCKFGALQLSMLQGINLLPAGAYQNRKWEVKDFEKVYKLECRENRTCNYTMTIFDYNYQNSFRFCFVICQSRWGLKNNSLDLHKKTTNSRILVVVVIALASKPHLVTRIARAGLGARLSNIIRNR